MNNLLSIKKYVSYILASSLLLLSASTLFLPSIGYTAEKREIIAGVNKGTAISYLDANGRFTGLEGEIFNKIVELLPQYNVKLQYLEQATLFPNLNSHKVDLVISNLRRTEAREKNSIRSRVAYNWTPYVLLVPADNTTIHSLADLSGKRIAQNKGTGQARIIENYNKEHHANIEIIYSPDFLSLLANGHIDAYLAPIFNVAAANKQFDNFKVKVVGEAVNGAIGTVDGDPNAYIWFNPEDTQLRDDVSAAIEKLRLDGTLSKLSVQFLGDDYPGQIDQEAEKNLER